MKRKVAIAFGLASIGCVVGAPLAKHYILLLFVGLFFARVWGWLNEEINPSPPGPY